MPPKYTLKMRGEAIEVIQPGYKVRTYTISQALEEGAVSTDGDRRYVLLRAVETLEGKSPQYWKRRGKAKVAGRWVDRWPTPPLILMTSVDKPKAKNPLSRIWKWILGL